MKAAPVVAGVIMAVTALLAVATGCGDDTGDRADSLPSPTRTPTPPAASTSAPADTQALNIQFLGAADLSDESKSSLAELIERIQSGVVQITTGSGSGSGFIVDADGLVITNEHVVGGEGTVSVWLTTGRRYQADVLERDEASDLALVRIDGGGSFHAIAVGDPGGVRVGDEVLALGFPLADSIGTDLTVTRGIISSTRTVAGVALLQTDAALNPGNSGGPLVSSAGEVVGVNTSKIEETVDGRPVSNIGFAVSVGELKRRLPTLGGRQIAAPGTPAPPPVPTFTPVPTYTPVTTSTPTSTPTLTPTQATRSALPLSQLVEICHDITSEGDAEKMLSVAYGMLDEAGLPDTLLDTAYNVYSVSRLAYAYESSSTGMPPPCNVTWTSYISFRLNFPSSPPESSVNAVKELIRAVYDRGGAR